MKGTREDTGVLAIEYALDGAKAFGFDLPNDLASRLRELYRKEDYERETEAVASALLKTGLVHEAARRLLKPEEGSYYEPQYHFHVLISATKAALDGLALWLKERKNLAVRDVNCDFTKEHYREKLTVSIPEDLRARIEHWLDQIRWYSIWQEHRGTMPILRLVDSVTGEHRTFEVLVDRANSDSQRLLEERLDTEDLGTLATYWPRRLAGFVSAFIQYGLDT